jgi:hypothetical protein
MNDYLVDDIPNPLFPTDILPFFDLNPPELRIRRTGPPGIENPQLKIFISPIFP